LLIEVTLNIRIVEGYRMPDTGYQIPDIRFRMPVRGKAKAGSSRLSYIIISRRLMNRRMSYWHLVSGIRNLASGIWHRVSGIRFPAIHRSSIGEMAI
jgi:hypothetical protein